MKDALERGPMRAQTSLLQGSAMVCSHFVHTCQGPDDDGEGETDDTPIVMFDWVLHGVKHLVRAREKRPSHWWCIGFACVVFVSRRMTWRITTVYWFWLHKWRWVSRCRNYSSTMWRSGIKKCLGGCRTQRWVRTVMVEEKKAWLLGHRGTFFEAFTLWSAEVVRIPQESKGTIFIIRNKIHIKILINFCRK